MKRPLQIRGFIFAKYIPHGLTTHIPYSCFSSKKCQCKWIFSIESRKYNFPFAGKSSYLQYRINFHFALLSPLWFICFGIVRVALLRQGLQLVFPNSWVQNMQNKTRSKVFSMETGIMQMFIHQLGFTLPKILSVCFKYVSKRQYHITK